MQGAVAYFFPGQGAQAVGMGRGFYDRYAESRDLYQRANAQLGFDVAALCFEGPLEELTKTQRCQPALLVTSLAAFAAFQSLAPALKPVGAAGLSLGELTALTAANAVRFDDALYLVQARAEAMAECAAHHPGAMLAVIGLSSDAIQDVCRQTGAVMANLNAPDQVVLSGTVETIERAEHAAKGAGAKRAVKLDVTGAFHSSLMEPAALTFRQALAKTPIKTPRFPIMSNVTGEAVADPESIRELLVKQIVSPVLWEPSVRRLVRDGATVFLEFPPARVLTGLLRRIDGSVKGIALHEPADFDNASELLKHSSVS